MNLLKLFAMATAFAIAGRFAWQQNLPGYRQGKSTVPLRIYFGFVRVVVGVLIFRIWVSIV